MVGKGGAGKSVLAGTLARTLARGGRTVLALDSDLMPGLSLSLGAGHAESTLADAAERDEHGRWRLRRGVGPVRAVRRHSLAAPDGVRLLVAGKQPGEGLEPIMPSVTAFYRVVHRIGNAPAFADWDLIGDLPAGPRHVAFDWAPYAETFLVLAEPTWKSALTARRILRISRSRPGATAWLVASRVRGSADRAHVAELVGEDIVAAVPADAAVVAAERAGVAPIDYAPDCDAVRAVELLVDDLTSLDGQATTAGAQG